MPAENLEEEGLPKNPDLELAQLKFRLGQESHKNDGALKQKLMESVEKDSMAKFYEDTCNELGWPIDKVELQKMKDANKAKLTELEEKIDKVNGIVETNRPDSKNQQYQNAIKQGDLLLNRIQKLSRVINI